MIPFVDCQGLAGAYTLAAVQTGQFELVHRVSSAGGFGDSTVNANRHLLGDGWEQDHGVSPDEWEPGQCGFLAGTPPCSGFSNLNMRSDRGPGADINRCMHELVQYAGRCTGTDGRRGPEIVSFESVQQAYSKGRDLMIDLADLLEELTGQQYDLHHVLMSGSSVGAAQRRHRYFFVLARVQFGIDPPERSALPDGRVVTYRDAIDDLVGAHVQWESQPYPLVEGDEPPPGAYARSLRNPTGMFDAHMAVSRGKAGAAVEAATRGWEPGTFLSEAFDALDYHPHALKKHRDFKDTNLRRGSSTYKGLNWPLRIKPDQPGYVLTGSCARDFAHWSEPRLLTIRELSRLMGYPDAWRWPYRVSVASSLLGKCAPVPSCRWIANWAARAINGEPGSPGRMIDDSEYLHQSTASYKDWLD